MVPYQAEIVTSCGVEGVRLPMDFEEGLAEGPWQFVVEDGLVQKWFEE